MLEALGNPGDFVGGLAVVVTLVHLAIQVRQNAVQLRENVGASRAEAVGATVEAFSRYRLQILASADVAQPYDKGRRDFASGRPPLQLAAHGAVLRPPGFGRFDPEFVASVDAAVAGAPAP